MSKKRFSLHTFGCKVNQYESQALREGLLEAGYAPADEGDLAADVHIVNTCSVTHRADRSARKLIRRARRKSPESRIVVTGCYASRDEEVLREMPEVDYVVKNDQKERIVPWLVNEDEQILQQPGYGDIFELKISRFSGRTRAFIKVQDGCDVYCTFCIIPFIRGSFRSRDPEEILSEARRLARNGYREIVLTGVCLGQYGREEGARYHLPSVLTELDGIDGIERVRLSSIEAHEISDELLDVMASSRTFCPHFHIPLQSGSDDVLKWMNRKHRTGLYRDVCARLKEVFDRPAISSDIMVGFPKETEADFEKTLELAREAEFCRIHVFPYSDREGTAASKMKPKVHSREIKRRRNRLMELAGELAARYKARFQGETDEVLIEESRDRKTGRLTGYTKRYIRVLLEGPDEWMGRRMQVRLSQRDAGTMEGRPVEFVGRSEVE